MIDPTLYQPFDIYSTQHSDEESQIDLANKNPSDSLASPWELALSLAKETFSFDLDTEDMELEI